MLNNEWKHAIERTVMASARVVVHIPIVGIVVTISPNFSLYRMVVFPAASRPTIRILISFLPKRPLNKPLITPPMFQSWLLLERDCKRQRNRRREKWKRENKGTCVFQRAFYENQLPLIVLGAKYFEYLCIRGQTSEQLPAKIRPRR